MSISTISPTESALRYAEFWRRLVAIAIDALLFFVLLRFGMRIWVNMEISEGKLPDPGHWPVLLLLVGGILYASLMESSAWQATLGKLLIGIKVTTVVGERMTFGRSLARSSAKLLSQAILYIGFIIAAFTDRRQALHDFIAGTLVLRR